MNECWEIFAHLEVFSAIPYLLNEYTWQDIQEGEILEFTAQEQIYVWLALQIGYKILYSLLK